MRRFLAVLLVLVGAVTTTSRRAQAQEIQLTGPLAGAPAVRELRLHRDKRIELAPTVSFSLLDSYERTIFTGLRANYNLTDWLAVGVFGTFGAIKMPTGLATQIDDVTQSRRTTEANDLTGGNISLNNRQTATSIGPDFKKQVGSTQWIFAPQVTVVPFRGKLSLFQKVFVDTDAYFFAGPAFIGVAERGNCTPDQTKTCAEPSAFDRQSRVAIAPTFGLGFAFYSGDWMSLGLEWRAYPYKLNQGGFDTRGAGKDSKFPDGKFNEEDRSFNFNQMLSISWSFYLPREARRSE
jgi:outer membrane beta-barrel protein